MADSEKKYKIFLSAAEPSADLHCANLINTLKEKNQNIQFLGVGGPKMQQAGCRLLEVTTKKAVMSYNAFTQISRFYKLIKKIQAYLAEQKPDVVIVCDSPAFNFHIAKAARAVNAKTVFYVAPQLWAWAPWRIKKLRNCCDKLCCILPFEQDWFSSRNVNTTFVGNPLLDEVTDDLENNIKDYSGFDPQHGKLALMPGSRLAEIETIWKHMQTVAKSLRRKYPRLEITTVAVDEEKKKILKNLHTIDFQTSYTIGNVYETARQSDFALVTSGSATLQVAAAGCPMAIMYQSSPFLWHAVGKWLIRTKHLSLVNILADSELVPEFMPYFKSTEPIEKAAMSLYTDPGKLAELSRQLIELVKPLKQNAAENTADIVSEFLESCPKPNSKGQYELWQKENETAKKSPPKTPADPEI